MMAARTETARRPISHTRRTRSRAWCAKRGDASPVICCARARCPTMRTRNYSRPRRMRFGTPLALGPLPGTCPSTWFSASSVTPRRRPRPFMCTPNDNGCSTPRRNTIQKTAASRCPSTPTEEQGAVAVIPDLSRTNEGCLVRYPAGWRIQTVGSLAVNGEHKHEQAGSYRRSGKRSGHREIRRSRNDRRIFGDRDERGGQGRLSSTHRVWLFQHGRACGPSGSQPEDRRSTPDRASKTVKFTAGKAFKDAVNQ